MPDNNFDPANFDNMEQTEAAAALGSMADFMWTLYQESIRAGFTKEQAIHLAAEWMRAVVAGGMK